MKDLAALARGLDETCLDLRYIHLRNGDLHLM